MGLDWNPGNKPKPGYESEFERLFAAHQKKGASWGEDELERFHAISTTAFETLQAPQIGLSAAADAWARDVYRSRARDEAEDVWLAKLRGFYVLDLVPPCDGIPRYTNGSPAGYVECFSFRAQFLLDCEYIIGTELLDAAYTSKLPTEFRAYGEALADRFDSFVAEKGLDPSSLGTDDDPESPAFHADVVGSAARWCLFWASRGHILDAYW